MTAEAWPTEDAATKAVDAAARKAWLENAKSLPPSMSVLLWDELPQVRKHDYLGAVLPIVWAALEALPDPRRTAWELGYSSGFRNGADLDRTEPVNPYPES